MPSKRMMASDGGAPQVAPGVTTGGTGSQTSVSSGFGAFACCAERVVAAASRAASAKDLENWLHMISRREYNRDLRLTCRQTAHGSFSLDPQRVHWRDAARSQSWYQRRDDGGRPESHDG